MSADSWYGAFTAGPDIGSPDPIVYEYSSWVLPEKTGAEERGRVLSRNSKRHPAKPSGLFVDFDRPKFDTFEWVYNGPDIDSGRIGLCPRTMGEQKEQGTAGLLPPGRHFWRAVGQRKESYAGAPIECQCRRRLHLMFRDCELAEVPFPHRTPSANGSPIISRLGFFRDPLRHLRAQSLARSPASVASFHGVANPSDGDFPSYSAYPQSAPNLRQAKRDRDAKMIGTLMAARCGRP